MISLPSVSSFATAALARFAQRIDAVFRHLADVIERRLLSLEGRLFDVTHYGAKGDGVTNDTLAIRRAEAARQLVPGGVLYFPARSGYLVTDTIDFDSTHTHVLFESEYGSRIIFAPASPKSCLRFGFNSVADPRTGWVHIENPGLVGGSVQEMVGIDIVDAHQALIDNPHISAWSQGGDDGLSTGIRLAGRDICTVRKININADIPIRFSENPNLSDAGPDHTHLHDMILQAINREMGCITVDPDISLASVLIDGDIAAVTDGHFFYAPALKPSIQLKIAGVLRDEHGDAADPNPAAHTVYIAPSTPGDKSFENVFLSSQYYGAATKQGPYLEGCASVVIDDLWRGGNDPAFEIVQPCNFVTVRHCIAAPPVIEGMTRVESVPTWGINSDLGPLNATYIRADDTNSRAGAYKQTFGVKKWGYGGLIEPGTANEIVLDPISLTGEFLCGTVTISYTNADFTVNGGGIFNVTAAGSTLLVGTSADVANYAAGKIGVRWLSRSAISVAQDLGEDLHIKVSCEFHDERP